MAKKLLIASVVIILIILLVGILVQTYVPGCHCDEGAGCHGCGVIGGFFASSSFLIMVLGLMAFVLGIWFGIPLLVLFGIFKLIAGFFNKNE